MREYFVRDKTSNGKVKSGWRKVYASSPEEAVAMDGWMRDLRSNFLPKKQRR